MRDAEILHPSYWVLGPSSLFSIILHGSSSGCDSFKLFKTIAVLHPVLSNSSQMVVSHRMCSLFVGLFVTSWQASSLFVTILQFSFEDCRVKEEEYATIFAVRKPSIIAPKEYATRPWRYCHYSQPISSEHRSRSSLIIELATHSKNWLPISYDICGLRRTGWRL